MAGGWSKDGAVQDQIDATTQDAVNQVRSRIPVGQSLTHCQQCANPIPQARRDAIQGVRLCVSCQAQVDKQQTLSSGFNRRGSKDSQLR
ncbi:MAG: phage/conjugal plasmid C-4 type zinc finger TraR family protein [Paraglaciecola sp.]|jgi:phage/conjugal plasmid C-4 type zinc finger TraR family protein